jgi:phospholipid/cholesterol/gamma-HCH transport system permease protein
VKRREEPGSNCAELRDEGAGRWTVLLHGALNAETVGGCWKMLQRELGRRHIRSLEVDASGAAIEGTIAVALLRYLESGKMTRGAATVTIRGVSQGTRELMDMFAPPDQLQPPPEPPLKWRIPEEVGEATRSAIRDLYEQVVFVGAVVAAIPPALTHPRRFRWREIRRVIEKAGANALPVIALFSWLMGLVMALEAARPLRNLGAEIFIADLIGFSSFRSTGPLVTAIMLAGRSGSAFAAELGTMKVNEELDALTTMGLNPVRFIALQRIIAAILLTPILSMYATVMSIIGGIMVMYFLGFPPLMIFEQIITRVEMFDLVLGMEKAVVFGVIIGAVGCLRGLQTKEGPRAVGASTTSSVVTSIVLIVLANTVFAAVIYALKK